MAILCAYCDCPIGNGEPIGQNTFMGHRTDLHADCMGIWDKMSEAEKVLHTHWLRTRWETVFDVPLRPSVACLVR